MVKMMAFKILFLMLTLLGVLYLTQAASTTNGKLLKFYPISKQQYKAILRLAKQPALEEDTMEESHRSLANWSSSWHDSWNQMWNATKNIFVTDETPNGIRKYPLCVIRTPEGHNHRGKRQAYDYPENYAGVLPNVVYPGAYPPAYPPAYPSAYPHPYPYSYPAYAAGNEEEGEGETEPETPTESDPSKPIINCIVVVRSKRPRPPTRPPPDTKPDSEDPDMPGHYQHYPHPYPLPPYGYPPYPYPFPAYPLQPPTEVTTARNNAVATSAAAAQYQQMLNEYYKHLHALYRADATTNMARNHNGAYYPYQYQPNDDDDYEEDDQQNDDDYDNEEIIEEEN